MVPVRHLLTWTLLLTALRMAPEAALLAAAPLRIACVGDSITEGAGLSNPGIESYPARLQRLLGTNSLVRNFGVSGCTLLKKGDRPYWNQPAFRQSHDFAPDVVLIKLGSNDAKPYNWRHGADFESDYEALIAGYAALSNSPRILLATPAPVYRNGAFDISPGVVTTNSPGSLHFYRLWKP